MTLALKRKIPTLFSIDGYNNVPIEECNESLVQLTESKRLKIANTYYQKNFEGSESVCYLRSSVAKMLLNASSNLPDGFVLVVNDGWRPYKVQLEIYKRVFENVKQIHPNFSKSQLHDEAAKYASIGSLIPEMPSPHFTGGAVDVTLANEVGVEFNMGSEFDASITESGTRFFEEMIENGSELSNAEFEALHNRRILFHLMIEAGFTNYSNEWWHFDYGNQLWGKIKNKNAIYGLTQP